ncbi:MAG TPA: SRPBCC domain-containing protein [Chitinophagaceae bacterium]
MAIEKVKIDSLINAAPEEVWECYTNPDHIVNWNFATPEWCCPSATNNLTVGGKYIARMEAKDGSFGFDFEAIYDEIVIPKKLAYTMSDGRKAIVSFNDLNGKTQAEIIFDAETENSIELQKAGWQAILDNFAKYVADR